MDSVDSINKEDETEDEHSLFCKSVAMQMRTVQNFQTLIFVSILCKFCVPGGDAEYASFYRVTQGVWHKVLWT